MAYDYFQSLAVTSSGLTLTSTGIGFYPVSVLFINSSTGAEPAYIRVGTAAASSGTGFPLAPGETFSRTLTCLDIESRKAWGSIGVACESSSSGQTATVRFYASAV
jgi:hypothetical protein